MTAASESQLRTKATEAADTLPRGARNPISFWVSLARNPLRTVPMMVVTLAASLGIAAVVMLADSLIRTALAPNDYLLGGLVVRADASTLDQVDAYVHGQAGTAVTTRVGPPTFVRGRIFQLDSYFLVLTVADDAAGPLLARYGDHVQTGRLPAPGSLEIAVPVGFAKSRNVTVGDTLGGPGDYTKLPLRIVGLIAGPRWVALGSASGIQAASKDTMQSILVYEPDDTVRAALETGVTGRFAGATVQHWTPRADGAPEQPYQDDLRLILTFIIVINSVVLSTVGGLLALLYFRQRQTEFLLLSILGRTKLDLCRRATAEIAVVIGAGWLAGLTLAWLLMAALQDVVFSERAIVLDLADPAPLLYTLPLAATTIAVSATVTVLSVIQFDTVAKLQARA